MFYSRLRQTGLVALAMFLALPTLATVPEQTSSAAQVILPCSSSYCGSGDAAMPSVK